ncbi:DUF190 domain-containing protein [Desulfogranum mediterraneum]|uniref:DUF190 domain-containing protein n=1 Tax=Desulfogranum mediterraneum TaxID=160661 RepID=UPI0003F60805|nr:DUF190 domain-containing protein [Desulfogranum mediterraneum]
MKLPEKGCQLRIIIGEARRYQGKPLYEWIVLQARSMGVAGATVFRGMMGYGANSRIKTSSILRLSEDLPVIIELVDTREVLEELLDQLDSVLSGGLVTMEELRIRMYRPPGER